MRVSTSMIFSSGTESMLRRQAEMLQTQQQLSTGKRVSKASDDPVAAANALTTQQSLALNAQFARNQGVAQATLGIVEATLGQVGDVLQDARALAVAAGNGSLSTADKKSLAIDLRGRIDTLVSLANARDGANGYLFAGYQEETQPFVQTGAGIVFQGDHGSRALQVAPQRTLQVNASGAEIFAGGFSGNGRFNVAASAGNSGSAVADTGRVTNPAAVDGHSYRVVFNVAGGLTTYDVVDTTTSANLTTGAAYTPGGSIGFGGLQFSLSGAPNNGDAFQVSPSTRQSVFKTLEDLATTLESSAGGTLNASVYQTRLGAAIAGIDQAHDQVLSVRTGFGAKLRELDVLGTLAADRAQHYSQELSRLTDIDYAEAISALSQQQISLQAAQQSYLRVTGMSLFNYL